MGVLNKGTDFSNGDQVTDTNLDNLVDNATFTSSAVDGSSTQISGAGAIIVRDGGITSGKFATGALNDVEVTATGSTTARSLSDRFAEVINVKDFGAVGDGVTDDTSAIQAAIDYCGTSGLRVIQFESGTYKTGTLNKTFNGLKLVGRGSGRPGASNDGGTQLLFTGTSGALIENGTDDGNPWDANNYDGPQGLIIEEMNLHADAAKRTTALNSYASNYNAGSYCIRDWRGGHIHLNNVMIEGFEYAFWGIQSDFNKFNTVTLAYCKYGFYLGPRTDQSNTIGLYAFFCDTPVVIDVSSNHKFNDVQFVITGSTLDHSVLINKGSSNIIFNTPWLENFSGDVDGLAFFGIGTNDGYSSTTTPVYDFIVNNPYVAVSGLGLAGPKYLVSITSAERAYIIEPVAARGTTASTNLTAYFYIPSGVTATGQDLIYSGASRSKALVNDGTGNPNLIAEERTSQWTLGSQTGRLSIVSSFGAAGADEIRISQSSLAGRIQMETPSYTTGQTRRLNFRRTFNDETAMPTSGTYETGDYVRNISPTVLGSASSQYVVRGWTRLTTGSGHVLNTDWVEDRALTGT